MKKKLTKDNRGFSLVELIIVIAIMAILVGILAPQFIKYVEKARVAKCATVRDNLLSELNATYADNSDDTTITDGSHNLSDEQAERYKCSEGGTLTYSVDADSHAITVTCSKHGPTEGKSFGDADTMAEFMKTFTSISTSAIDSTATDGNNAKQTDVLKALKEAGLGYLLDGVADWRFNGTNFYFTYQSIPQDGPTDILMIQYRPDSKHFTVWKTRTTQPAGKDYYILGGTGGKCLNDGSDNDQTYENAVAVYNEELKKMNQ